MKNKIINISTKVMAAMIVASTVISSTTVQTFAAELPADVQETSVETFVETEGRGDVIDDEFAAAPVEEGRGDIIDDEFVETEGRGDVIDDEFAAAPVEEGRGDIIDDEFVETEGRGDVIDDEFVVVPEVPEQMNSVTTEETPTGTSSVFCSSERLDEIAAMEITDPAIRAMRDRAVEADRSIFCAGLLKRYFLQEGPNKTFILGIYFIPSPFVYEIVEAIEEEVKNGNRSYIYNGQFYASPEEDPSFNEFLINKKN